MSFNYTNFILQNEPEKNIFIDRSGNKCSAPVLNISNGNRTEGSTIRSVVIKVVTNRTIAQRESDLFITSMITDRIGRRYSSFLGNCNFYD